MVSLQKWDGKKMKRAIKLFVSSMKKQKGILIIIGVLSMLITILMNVCMTATGVTKCMDDLKKRTNASDVMIFTADSANSDLNAESKLKEIEEISSVETRELIYLNGIASKNPDAEEGETLFAGNYLFLQNDGKNDKVMLFDDVKKGDSDILSIYVPYLLRGKGIEIDDEIFLSTGLGFKKKFRIAGYLETSFFFIPTYSDSLIVRMPEADYNEFEKELKNFVSQNSIAEYDIKGKLHGVKSYPDTNIEKLSRKIDKELSEFSYSQISFKYETESLSSTIGLYSGILMVFSVLLLITVLIVVAFRVADIIKQDFQKIATLKAIGYKSSEIRISYILQFGIPIAVMTLIGIVISYLLNGMLKSIVLSITGINWDVGLHIVTDIITFIIVLGFFAVMLLLATRKLSKISPVSAFQSNSSTSSKGCNKFSLSNSKGGLSRILAFRSIVIHKSQTAVILITSMLLVFVTCLIATITINITNNDEFWNRVLGEETTDYLVRFDEKSDYKKIREEITSLDGVNRILTEVVVNVEMSKDKDGAEPMEGQKVWLIDDLKSMRYINVYEGRIPENTNEILLSDIQQNELGLKIGEQVNIKYESRIYDEKTNKYENGTYEKTLKIVGFTKNNAKFAIADIGLYDELRSSEIKTFLVYAEEKSDYAAFLKHFEDKFGKASPINKNGAITIENYAETIENTRNEISAPFQLISYFMIIVTALIVSFIISVIIKANIFNKKTDYGILRAIGCSNKEIMNIIIFSVFPCVAVGSIAGGIISIVSVKPLFNAVFNVLFGIANAKVDVFVFAMILISIAVSLISLLISWHMSKKIKDITVYSLISE